MGAACYFRYERGFCPCHLAISTCVEIQKTGRFLRWLVFKYHCARSPFFFVVSFAVVCVEFAAFVSMAPCRLGRFVTLRARRTAMAAPAKIEKKIFRDEKGGGK